MLTLLKSSVLIPASIQIEAGPSVHATVLPAVKRASILPMLPAVRVGPGDRQAAFDSRRAQRL